MSAEPPDADPPEAVAAAPSTRPPTPRSPVPVEAALRLVPLLPDAHRAAAERAVWAYAAAHAARWTHDGIEPDRLTYEAVLDALIESIYRMLESSRHFLDDPSRVAAVRKALYRDGPWSGFDRPWPAKLAWMRGLHAAMAGPYADLFREGHNGFFLARFGEVLDSAAACTPPLPGGGDDHGVFTAACALEAALEDGLTAWFEAGGTDDALDAALAGARASEPPAEAPGVERPPIEPPGSDPPAVEPPPGEPDDAPPVGDPPPGESPDE